MSAALSRHRQDRVLLVIESAAGIAVVAALFGSAYGGAAAVVFLLACVATTFTGFVLYRMLGAVRDSALDVVGRIRDEERERLEEEKRLLLQGIKELEADAGMGKVDAADYEHLRRTAEAQALAIIHKLREMDARLLAEARRLAGVSATPSVVDPMGTRDAKHEAPQEAHFPLPKGRGAGAQSAVFDDRPVSHSLREDVLLCDACGTSQPSAGQFCVGCGRPFALPHEVAELTKLREEGGAA